MLVFADEDTEDGISYSHELNHWQCLDQSPLLTFCEPLHYAISWPDLESYSQSQKTAL